jgi:hypothetical protein
MEVLVSDTVTTGWAPPRSTAHLGLAVRWWQRAILAFAVSRVVSTSLWFLVIGLARRGSRIGPHATLTNAMAAWDGQWYELVARVGYPARLPIGADHIVQANPWAFLPAYPWLAELLTFGHPGAWPAAAEALSTACGFGCAVLLAHLLRPHVGDLGAQRAVWLFSLSPVAFLLQAAYAESMGMLLTLAALCLIDRHRYLLAVLPTVVLAFTRPGSQALALTIGIHLAARWIGAWRAGGRPPVRAALSGGLLLAVATVSGFVWEWIAAAVTGVPNAYLATELAWRTTWTGPGPFVPIVSWIFAADFWTGRWGPIVFALIMAGSAAFLLAPAIRRCGLTAWAWTASWWLYLLGVFFPQSSTFRLLLPMAPAGGVVAGLRPVVFRIVLAGAVALQAVWLYYTFGGWQFFWSIP